MLMRVGEMRVGEMRVGKMRVGKMRVSEMSLNPLQAKPGVKYLMPGMRTHVHQREPLLLPVCTESKGSM